MATKKTNTVEVASAQTDLSKMTKIELFEKLNQETTKLIVANERVDTLQTQLAEANTAIDNLERTFEEDAETIKKNLNEKIENVTNKLKEAQLENQILTSLVNDEVREKRQWIITAAVLVCTTIVAIIAYALK